MPDDGSPNPPPPSTQGRLDLFYMCVVVAICAAVVTALAWTHSTTKDSKLSYVQTGALSYSAQATSGSIYGSQGLTTGEPIYVSAVRPVQVSYRYRLQTRAPAEILGTEQLVAVMGNGHGITRSTSLQTVTSFRGQSFVATGTLDPAWLVSTANDFNKAPESIASGVYTLTISPSVQVHGRIGATPLVASLDKPSTFTFNGTVLTPNAIPQSAAPSATSQAAVSGPTANLAVEVPGSITVPHSAAATLLGVLPVSASRVAGPLLIVLALLGGWLVGGRLLKEATSDDEGVRIAARHGRSMVGVDSLPGHPGVVVIDLSSFDGLMQVSRRLECPILHRRGSQPAFAVVDNGTLYRYQARLPGAFAVAGVQTVDMHSNGHVAPRPEPAV